MNDSYHSRRPSEDETKVQYLEDCPEEPLFEFWIYFEFRYSNFEFPRFARCGRRVFASCCEAKGVTHGGALRSKNVGTSNHNGGENPPRRKTKVSLAMTISQGLVGPKGMTKVAPDGYTVNIP